MRKEDILDVLGKFEDIHDPHEDNMILGDFNFADLDIDKGKNMTSKDHTIKPIWDDFKSRCAIVDPFRVQFPKKRIFSFTMNQGKSRGDRVYISEDNLATIKNFRYTITPFPMAHKMMTFDLQNAPKIGAATWKMNSSVLNDTRYRNDIEDIFNDLNAMDIESSIDWWELFITVVQGTTMAYTQGKARVKHALKKFLVNKIEALEQQPQLYNSQLDSYSSDSTKFFRTRLGVTR